MALSRVQDKSSTYAIPNDAVVLTEDEALAYQLKVISDWDKKSEVWALHHSATILGSISALTGIFVNNHFRTRLRLGTAGQMSSYLPIVVVPAMFSILTHKYFIQRPLVLNPLGDCPVCQSVRSAIFQAGFGVIYPTILAPFAGFMFATRHYTYRLPSITENPKEVFNVYRKMARPILPILGTLLCGQSLIAMYLTYKELQQVVQLELRMQKIEAEVEAELEEKRAMAAF